MRLFNATRDQYIPNDNLRAVARQTIKKLLAEHGNELQHALEFRIDEVIVASFGPTAPAEDVVELVEMMCEGIETFRLSAFSLRYLIAPLIKSHTEVLLDAVFNRGEDRQRLTSWLFRERMEVGDASLNEAPLTKIMAWCGNDQERIQKIATVVSSYVPVDSKSSSEDHPNRMVLSDHIKSLLAAATDKHAMVETIFEDINPISWSGSRAKIMKIRSKAFEELLAYPDAEVKIQVQTKLSILEQAIRREQAREAAEHNEREQRFE